MADRANDNFIKALRRSYQAHGDPERAARARAYMKSRRAFHGLPMKTMRSLLREVFADHPLDSWPEQRDTALRLWDEVHFHEERYAALELIQRGWRKVAAEEGLPLARKLILDAQWWDLCDTIASDLLGGLWKREPEAMRHAMEAWGGDEELWVRRCAVLSQLKSKERTDEELLFRLCAEQLDDKTFWMRKGIGWALRQYARSRAEPVRAFVAEHGDAMAGLTRREASKHL